ncbi:hypothetical protein ACW2Q0_29315 [Nocardia sp. R16R-3T]
MYTIDGVMQVVDRHPVLFVALAFATYGFGFAQYLTSMYMQIRNKDCPFFFWQHAWYFGHDLTFVLLFSMWFFQVDHWLFKLLWAGCVTFVAIEIYSLQLVVRNERQSVFGRYYTEPVSARTAWIRGIAAYSAGVILFMVIRAAIGDVMCLVLMMSTNATLAIATQFKLEETKVRQPGIIALAWFTLLGTILTFMPPGYGFFSTAVTALDAPWFYVLGALSTVCALRFVILAHRMPKQGSPHEPVPTASDTAGRPTASA